MKKRYYIALLDVKKQYYIGSLDAEKSQIASFDVEKIVLFD